MSFQRADTQEPLILDSPTNIPPALADALDESKLPTEIPELVTELSKRAHDVEDRAMRVQEVPSRDDLTHGVIVDEQAGMGLGHATAARDDADRSVRR